MGRFFLTGDTHGKFDRLEFFCKRENTTKDDILCILGDVGLNYYLDSSDWKRKQWVAEMPITVFCIHGNHEERPFNIPTYKIKEWNGGRVYYEEEFPTILFAIDGEIYNINKKSCLVIGGAYSVDKEYRLLNGYHWFKDEQPSKEIIKYVEKQISKQKHFDLVLSHTCPIETEPRHMFLPFIDQSKVDKMTENFLQRVADIITFDNWYFGHYHSDWDNGKYHMLYTGFVEIK
jgi:3-oxoacid CoA-transferase subunit A